MSIDLPSGSPPVRVAFYNDPKVRSVVYQVTLCALIALGVYPFVVPFVPISGTPLESHPPPAPAFMHEILQPLARMLGAAGLRATDIKAGCGKCGACSALSTYERDAAERETREAAE